MQQCKLAPSQLSLFTEVPDSPEAAILQAGGQRLPQQLEHFAKQMTEFDAFLTSLDGSSPQESWWLVLVFLGEIRHIYPYMWMTRKRL